MNAVESVYKVFFGYQDTLPSDEGSIGLFTFHDIVKLFMMYGESKSGFLHTT